MLIYPRSYDSLNFYADATMWKPYHHDSHAYGANGKKEVRERRSIKILGINCLGHGMGVFLLFKHSFSPSSLSLTRQDFTMGASFGATRELAFKHVASGQIFSFPQGNGDVFAFTSEVVRAMPGGDLAGWLI